jgi:hypothetical protein
VLNHLAIPIHPIRPIPPVPHAITQAQKSSPIVNELVSFVNELVSFVNDLVSFGEPLVIWQASNPEHSRKRLCVHATTLDTTAGAVNDLVSFVNELAWSCIVV